MQYNFPPIHTRYRESLQFSYSIVLILLFSVYRLLEQSGIATSLPRPSNNYSPIWHFLKLSAEQYILFPRHFIIFPFLWHIVSRMSPLIFEANVLENKVNSGISCNINSLRLPHHIVIFFILSIRPFRFFCLNSSHSFYFCHSCMFRVLCRISVLFISLFLFVHHDTWSASPFWWSGSVSA